MRCVNTRIVHHLVLSRISGTEAFVYHQLTKNETVMLSFRAPSEEQVYTCHSERLARNEGRACHSEPKARNELSFRAISEERTISQSEAPSHSTSQSEAVGLAC
jgi:hypothetical protein